MFYCVMVGDFSCGWLSQSYEKYAGSSALLLTELELVRAEAGAPTLALALLKLQAGGCLIVLPGIMQ